MRHLLTLALGLGMLSGLGCLHETCDCEHPVFLGCCPRDICSACCDAKGHDVVVPGPEMIKVAPAVKDGETKPDTLKVEPPKPE